LTRLTLKQLDGILGAEHLSGGTNIRRWGELFDGDGWTDRPIHVYGPALDSVAALFIRRAVLRDSRKWNPHYREVVTGWSAVLASLARDPAGIAYAPVLPGQEGTKSLALAADDGGPSYALTAQTVAGTIRVGGHGSYDRSQDFIGTLVLAWEEGFRERQPQVSFENHLNGTAAAIGALYTGAGDLALMGREIWPPEIAAFKE